MASTKTAAARLDEVEPRLDALEQALGLRPPQPKGHWLRQFWDTVLSHPSMAIVTTVLLFIIGYAISQVKGAFDDAVQHRIENTLKQSNGVLDKLDAIQDTAKETNTTLLTLKPFIQDLVRHEFNSASALAPGSLQRHLPAVADMLKVARREEVKIEPKITDSLRQSLQQVSPASDSYWPAVGQLISYQSSQQPLPTALPECSSAGNVPTIIVAGGPAAEAMYADILMSNCYLDLDRSDIWSVDKDGQRIITQSGEVVSNYRLQLRNVVVHYTGTPLTHVTKITFEHCILDFNLNNLSHSPSGQNLTKQLLAKADPSSAEIDLS